MVIPMPVSRALMRLPANFAMMLFRRQPAIARIAFDIIVIPWRNSARPPTRPISMGMRENGSSFIVWSCWVLT